jgi:hypothetical protein
MSLQEVTRRVRKEQTGTYTSSPPTASPTTSVSNDKPLLKISASATDLPLFVINESKRWFCMTKQEAKERTTVTTSTSLPVRIVGALVCLLLVWYHLTYSLPAYNNSSVNSCRVAEQTKQKLLTLQSKTSPAVKLPKIIHHQWKNMDIPLKYKAWYQAWFDLFPEPEFTHMHWTDEAGRKLIEDDYAWFLPTYDSYDYNIKRVDVVRYFALHKYGGIHGDLDYEPLVNFYDALPQDRVSVVESPYQYYEQTQNSLMSSPSGDSFWPRVFTQLVANKDMSVMEATGPKLLDTVMATDSSSHEHVHILPCENFQRIPLGETHVAPFLARFHKELLGRFYPMKQCGDFTSLEGSCQYARHHCSAAYLEETGIWDLLWKKS